MSEWFGIEVRLRKTCVMSLWLFNMYMDGIVREVHGWVGEKGVEMVGQGVIDGELTIYCLSMLIGDSRDILEEILRVFHEV